MKGRRESAAKGVGPYAFILSFGLVSMLMDTVYEGALAVQGPLLAGLGANALIVGVVSGLGEATSLAGRLFSGPLADRTGRYWLFAILGYAATAVAVPAMGFVGSLVGVSALIVFERFGKSLRTPSRDAMISHAAARVGRGKGFAMHEVMDQIGAMAGPLVVATLLSATHNDYRVALGALVIPGAAAICVLLVLRHRQPDPSRYEPEPEKAEGARGADTTDASGEAAGRHGSKPPAQAEQGKGAAKAGLRKAGREPLPRVYWLYTAACAVMLTGVATFGVLSYHMVSTGLADDALVPVLYAVAMAVDGVFAAITGVLYDRLGTKVLLCLPFVCAAIPFFAYAPALGVVVVGVVLWGMSLGVQESTMRAAVADMVPVRRRATAYGMFSMFVGLGNLAGGVIAGALYDASLTMLVVYVLCAEACGLVLLLMAQHRKKSAEA